MQRMATLRFKTWMVGLAVLLAPSSTASAQHQEQRTIQLASVVLNEAMATPGNRIPQSMLADAHGVAIIPNVVKGSFIVGARHGRGVLFVREPSGIWHAPVFISVTGGNIGWQVGVQSSDIVLVFKTARSIQGILDGKLTLGADVAAAAGPVGRQGGIATDGQLGAEIYTYSRSRGLFAGVSVDGSVLQMDRFANGLYYRSGPAGQVTVPPAATQLTQLIASYAGSRPVVPAPEHTTALQGEFVQQYGAAESEVVRDQLLEIAPRLFALLDEHWSTYLALPPELLRGEDPPPLELQSTIDRFRTVASNTQYQQLTSRPEFQSVFALLKHYQQSLQTSPTEIQLPPPPAK
ncbi:lipid-binding SYLF domain-containing protein [Roseimaritima sediminicola]|uniref:lipid-binding SYLF domain-containing protein n=1 Tax=Roseimaritima sediminicola TaxID=2662066 RepID=UPI0012982661|nr:lipid-binding SYLF domain-containing protein [Roseimaritima sediminicola]